MPQETQIVPKWRHPHVETHINDNTFVEDTAYSEDDNSIKFLSVFTSSKGIDNVLVKKKSLKSFKRTFGETDYKKHGQPLMMPIAILSQPGRIVQCMRIMPDDATYANVIISAVYKADAASKKFLLGYKASYVPNAFSQSEIDMEFAVLKAKVDPDAQGFVTKPLLSARVPGRGTYGNYNRLRISRSLSAEKDYGIKVYNYNVISAENGLESIGNYVGSMVMSPKYNQSTLINDMIDELEIGESFLSINVDEDAVIELYDEFVEFMKALPVGGDVDSIPDLDGFDMFFGQDIAVARAHKNIKILTPTSPEVTGLIAIDAIDGIPFTGGSNGAFDVVGTAETSRVAAYRKAFSGEYDKSIISPNRVPLDRILDANYPFEVKEVLYELALLRGDALLHLDSGIVMNTAQIAGVVEEMSVFNNRICSKEFQHYQIRDAVTRKKIAVTSTYNLALNLATHIQTQGNHVPFVKKHTVVTGHIRNSLLPCIDSCDYELKEMLYDGRINYYEAVAENEYHRATQSVAQPLLSDLLEENNMAVLLEAKRIVEYECNLNTYNFSGPEERKSFTEYMEAKFANWNKRKVESINILFDMNTWEAERSILHCYVAIKFRKLAKRTIIEIDVNKNDGQ